MNGSRKRILLVAQTTGYQARVFADAARRLDLDLELATDRCHVLDDPWADQAVAVRFESPEESVEVLAAALRCDGVVGVGDRPSHLAALVAERWGVPGHPPAAVAACRNKFLARERFREAGLSVPEYFRVDLEEDPPTAARRAPYPCVLKPLGLSASRGVIRANDERDFVEAFRRIGDLLAAPDILRFRDPGDRCLQVESFIEGKEYALEGLVTGGKLRVLALFDKPDPLDGPYFEETIYVTPSRAPEQVQAELIAAAGRAVEALGLRHGPVHAEMRHNRHGAWMLEVAARPIGGLCARALRFQHDRPLEELILRHALGDEIGEVRLRDPARGVMMIPIPAAGVFVEAHGQDRASAVPGVEEVIISAKQGQKLLPLPEGSSYLGFLFARGESAEDVEASLRCAHGELEIEMVGSLPIAPQRRRER